MKIAEQEKTNSQIAQEEILKKYNKGGVRMSSLYIGADTDQEADEIARAAMNMAKQTLKADEKRLKIKILED